MATLADTLYILFANAAEGRKTAVSHAYITCMEVACRVARVIRRRRQYA